MTNECDVGGCCSLPTERAPTARRSRPAALLAEPRVGVGLHLCALSDGGLASVFLLLKGYGAACCVLRELAEAAVMALSGLLGCGCVRSRRGELGRMSCASSAHSHA